MTHPNRLPRALRLALIAGLTLNANPARGDRAERLAGVSRAERARAAAELRQWLADSDRGVRRRAALAAGRIGDPVLAPAVASLLQDSEAAVRQIAALSAGLLATDSTRAALEAGLSDPDAAVRGRAAEALGRLSPPTTAARLSRHLERLLPPGPHVVLRDEPAAASPDPWSEARLTLLALALQRDRDTTRALLLPASGPRIDWWPATWLALRSQDSGLVPVLEAATRASSGQSRALAAEGLGALGDASHVAPLAALLTDPAPSVVSSALRALARAPSREASLAAASALQAPLPRHRALALEVLASGPALPEFAPRVAPALADADPVVRASAHLALARLDPDGYGILLSGLEPDANWRVRRGVAHAAALVGGELADAVLSTLARDPDPRVATASWRLRPGGRGPATDPNTQTLSLAGLAIRLQAGDGASEPDRVWRAAAQLPRGQRLALIDLAPRAPRERLLDLASADPDNVLRLLAAGRRPGAVAPARPVADHLAAVAPYQPELARDIYGPRAILETTAGRVEALLDVVDAPFTAANFADLARRGYYDGQTFHDVVADALVHAGEPNGDGSGGPGYRLAPEPNLHPVVRGTLATPLAPHGDSGSQFVIALSALPDRDGACTAFGTVIVGLDVLDRLRPDDRILRVAIWDGR